MQRADSNAHRITLTIAATLLKDVGAIATPTLADGLWSGVTNAGHYTWPALTTNTSARRPWKRLFARKDYCAMRKKQPTSLSL